MPSPIDLQALMKRAIRLAKKGEGFVHPNPLVGAVILQDGVVVGEGYHMEVGQPHAEVNAIRAARRRGFDVRGAAMVVTLEPCAHFGRTPPCVEALVEAGITEVYVGMIDPNPRVAGRGLAFLREHGIVVRERILEPECAAINEEFVKYITLRRPYVVVKAAMTLDGKIATRTGRSQWISSTESLQFAHRLRHRYQAIMVGAGTVRADDPQLTCRAPMRRVSHPIRIIVDGKLSISPTARVVTGGLPGRTIIVTSETSDPAVRQRLQDAGCELVVMEGDGRVDLSCLMDKLGELKIASLMIEGGSTLLAEALAARIVDRIYLVVAPKIFGGAGALPVFGGAGVAEVDEAWGVTDMKVSRLGADLLIEGHLRGGAA